MNIRSLYFRLILWYSGVVIIVSLAFGAYMYQSMQGRLYGEIERTLERRAHQIAANELSRFASAKPETIAERINEVYSPAANNRFIRITDEAGMVMYLSPAPKDESFDPNGVVATSGSNTKIQHLPHGVDILMVDVTESVSGEHFLIEMGAPTTDIQLALHGLIITLLLGLPVVVLIVSAVGYVLVRRSLKPVEDIRATAEKITFGNLSNRLPVVATGDALEHLSVTLNQMLGRLEDAYHQASRFSADASHELRTPLAIMRGELEAILAHEVTIGNQLQDRIGSVLEETERLSQITESLFAISRLDAGEKAEQTTFSLAELVRSTTDQMSLMAEVNGITVTIDTKAPAAVTGDASRIKQVIVNLLGNAIKYTPRQGSIVIEVWEMHHKACLEITDSGIGIAPEDQTKIFERFYRTDTARSREEGGAGLGLSIVRAICHAHGGTVEVESADMNGSTFRVLLPLAEGV